MESLPPSDATLPVAKEPARSKLWIPCGCMVAALLLMIFVPAMSLFVWNHDKGRKVDQQMAKIVAAGQPTTYVELDQFYALPSGAADTTQLWLDGMEILVADKLPDAAKSLPFVGDGKPPLLGEPWPEINKAEELLKRYAEAMDKFHAATKLGGAARYPIVFSNGYEMKLEHAQNLRSAARLLALEAYVRGHRGDASGCAESLRGIFAARRSLEQEPVVISNLVCIALHSIAIQALADNLAHVKFSEADLRALQDDINSFKPRNGLQRGFIGERVIGCEGYQSGGISVESKRIPFINSDFAFYLELFDDLITATNEDFPQCLAAGPKYDQKLKAMIGGSFSKFSHIVSALLAPAMSAAFEASARTTAESGGANAAIAVEFYRRKHGRLPQSLDELVPEFLPRVPQDPYVGAPLKYIAAPDHFKIYSVGRDGKDDGGDRSDARRDVVVYVPLPGSR